MRKKIGVGILAGLLIAGGAAASPAMAHTGDMSVTAVCNTQTGQYDFSVTLTTANTGLAGSTKWRVGTGNFEGTPGSDAGMDRGPVSSTGAQTITLGGFSLPGNTTGKGPWVYAHTSWTDGYSKGSDGQLLQSLAGDCKIPEPPFEGVTKYTPSYSATCEAASYSHPAIKTGFGVANIYGIRYGATQAEAQAKPFEAYTPGTVVTYPFADQYVANGYYFELKVGYDGANLTHQIGQTRGTSEACPRPIPEQPLPLTGTEARDSAPVCEVPADGTAIIIREGRSWEQGHTFDEASWTWVLNADKVYTDWMVTDEIIIELEDCDPVVPPTEEPKVPDSTPKQPTPPVKAELAVTGSNSPGAAIATAGALTLLAAGSLLIARRFAHK